MFQLMKSECFSRKRSLSEKNRVVASQIPSQTWNSCCVTFSVWPQRVVTKAKLEFEI